MERDNSFTDNNQYETEFVGVGLLDVVPSSVNSYQDSNEFLDPFNDDEEELTNLYQNIRLFNSPIKGIRIFFNLNSLENREQEDNKTDDEEEEKTNTSINSALSLPMETSISPLDLEN
jgi:hypothetical protein